MAFDRGRADGARPGVARTPVFLPVDLFEGLPSLAVDWGVGLAGAFFLSCSGGRDALVVPLNSVKATSCDACGGCGGGDGGDGFVFDAIERNGLTGSKFSVSKTVAGREGSLGSGMRGHLQVGQFKRDIKFIR